MTKPLRKTVEIIAKTIPTPSRILEIGSRQEKNQKGLANLRELFKGVSYLGTDMRPGSGVDLVADAESLPFPDKSFDLVICLETLEHARRPWMMAKEIERVLSNKGVVIVSSQQNFPLHRHPSDYFRYTPFGLVSLFEQLRSCLVFSISPPFDNEVKLNPQAVVAVISKGEKRELMKKIKVELIKNKAVISVHKPYRHRLIDMIRFFKRGLAEIQFRQEIGFF